MQHTLHQHHIRLDGIENTMPLNRIGSHGRRYLPMHAANFRIVQNETERRLDPVEVEYGALHAELLDAVVANIRQVVF